MTASVLRRDARSYRPTYPSNVAPSAILEYTYYGLVFYSIMGTALGFSVPLVGAAFAAVLALYCVITQGPAGIVALSQVAFALGCAISFVLIQLVIHGESSLDEYVRAFVNWIPALILVQCLTLRRGFLHRSALATFAIGLSTLPYLNLAYTFGGGDAEVGRAGLDRSVTLANPNDLAAWFGFCAVYFTVAGNEAKTTWGRLTSWIAALASLYIVGLTISRGPLFAFAVASIVSLRRLLKRAFVPFLLFIILGWISYQSGVFEKIGAAYAARGLEQSGRFEVWPLALERFLNAPIGGVGVSNLATRVPQIAEAVTPHNGFILVALASGIIPLTFFLAYWWRSFRGVYRGIAEREPSSAYHLPLLIYAFLITLQLNMPFVSFWMLTTLSCAIAADTPRHPRRVVMRRGGQRVISTLVSSRIHKP
jgi:hypothetical protein